jgi:hypothetical protein
MMRRSLAALLLLLTTAACGARSELLDPASACTQLGIGILGNPGAYSGADFEQWLITSGATAERIQTTADEPLTAASLEGFDVVVLDWLTRDYSASEAATFADWVTAGGGVVSMTGWDNVVADDWHPNSLLAPLEVAYSGPLLNGPVTSLAKHPITKGLTLVVFNGGYAVSDLGGDASTRTPLASLATDEGDVNVGYAIKMGKGRAFVWGDEWIEFPSKGSDFLPQLWVQGFGWIAPSHRCLLTPPG